MSTYSSYMNRVALHSLVSSPATYLSTFMAICLLLYPIFEAACEELPREVVGGGTAELPTKLTLTESLQLAKSRNIDLKRAEESVSKQRAKLIEAWGTLFPEISINGNANRLDEGRTFQFGDNRVNAQTWNGNVQLDQPIFRGGKGIAGKNVQDALLDAISWQQRGTQNVVAEQVYQAYFKVLLDRELLKVREEAVELLREELTKAQRKFNVGTVSSFDVIRSEVALANAQTPLIQANNALALSLEDLKRVLNVDCDREILAPRIIEPLSQVWDGYKLESALSVAHETNPELKRLEHLVDASKHGINLQRADFLPALSFSVNYGVERPAFVDQNLEGWETRLNLTWKIFDSFQTISRVNQAQSDFKDASLAYERAKLDTDIAVRRAISSVHEARELVSVSSKVISQAEESFRLAQNRFDVGSATQLDVLAERLALTQARSNNAEALYSQNIAEVALRRAIGIAGVAFQEKD
jgi:outer membrane protein